MDNAPLLSKSPEREAQTPPRKAISSSNGVLKRHFTHHAPPIPVVYKECLKNHAASIGGHALDGCGEFLPAATANPADPTSLKCGACGCHRNFHHREVDDYPAVSPTPMIEYHPHHRHHPPHTARESHSPPPISSSYMLLSLGGGSGNPNSSTRKRFRSKFRQDQKEKMLELAEKMGWKMQKNHEEMVNQICREIGVERGVFKVWMHNNKSTKRSVIDVSGDRNGSLKIQENNNVNGEIKHLFNGKSNHPANVCSSSS